MAKEICPVCRGRKIVKCEDYGLTYGMYDHSNVTIQGPCPACGGSGNIPCPECHGTGKVDDWD